MNLYDEDVRDALIAGLENHTGGVQGVEESADPDNRALIVEMADGAKYHVEVSIEVVAL